MKRRKIKMESVQQNGGQNENERKKEGNNALEREKKRLEREKEFGVSKIGRVPWSHHYVNVCKSPDPKCSLLGLGSAPLFNNNCSLKLTKKTQHQPP